MSLKKIVLAMIAPFLLFGFQQVVAQDVLGTYNVDDEVGYKRGDTIHAEFVCFRQSEKLDRIYADNLKDLGGLYAVNYAYPAFDAVRNGADLYCSSGLLADITFVGVNPAKAARALQLRTASRNTERYVQDLTPCRSTANTVTFCDFPLGGTIHSIVLDHKAFVSPDPTAQIVGKNFVAKGPFAAGGMVILPMKHRVYDNDDRLGVNTDMIMPVEN
ncbi:MAG: hypothetical protein ACI9VM_000358 [Candidatus Azotimanducaceae bacterium]